MGIKLSEVLDKLMKIQNLDFESSVSKLNLLIETVNQNTKDLPFINKHELSLLEKNLQENIKQYQDCILKLEEKLKNTIFSNENEYFKTSEVIWANNSEKMVFKEHLEWAPLWPPSPIELENFMSQIKRFVGWEYAGLVIGSKNSDIIKSLSSTEPLYVAERYTEYFSLQKEKFHQDYSRKIRFYDINDIKRLPNNSIGIAVVYNEFPFLPWKAISSMLYHLSNKIIAGGTIIFNYNNCETVRGFKQFENHSMTYSTPKMYEEFLLKYNMHCTGQYDSDREIFSFLTFTKDGQKELIKRYPSVGFIKQQSTFSDQILHEQRIDTIKKVIKAKSI